jgi:hypothetical protein
MRDIVSRPALRCRSPFAHPRRLRLPRGTFAPARRAFDNPIAIACLRLFTFLPLRPLRSVPRFLSCIARFTSAEAFLL